MGYFNLKKTAVYCLLLLVVMAGNSCKRPRASFNIDKAAYSAGEDILIQDNSRKMNTYIWTLKGPGYEKKYEGAINSIRLNPCSPDGNYTLTLHAKGKKGSLFLEDASLLVKTVRGRLYLSNPGTSEIVITADNQELVTIPAKSSKDLDMAIGVWYLSASNGKQRTVHIKEDSSYSWSINQ